ncbi:response regulator [Winogradskyella psychrotolerans]|uniref:response regulator n=1 Tax=Winogradskyella psychrotolerans TaxID=1344585 RepID=UPI001C079395|nr:response regulator [Winogradskyella psychrotolerans]MBU2920415.1 response regulator [Winogradskyella psychrotolerans]
MKTVLLIEDDTVLRENTAELLELSNYEVITAANGQIGLEVARNQTPDIIICDIMMPILDGYAVLEGLSKQDSTKFIPFIFLSAKTERGDVRKGMNLGADDYITKPFSEDEILSAIESRIAKAAILKDERESANNTSDTNEDELRTLNDLKNFFDDNGKIFNYSKNDIIYKEGHNSNYIYLVTKGIVRCYKFDEKGKELTTALYKEDDLFGYTSFTDNIPYRETAIALKDVEMVGVSKAQLKEVLDKNHKLTLEVIQLLTDDITGVKDQLLQMAYSSVQRKTALTILRFAEKINSKPEDPIKISRNDLASVAGIATETLIRTMSHFKKQGLIEMEGRNIKVLDLQKLQDIH